MLAGLRPNKKDQDIDHNCGMHICPLGDVKFEPIPPRQNVLFGTTRRSQNHDTLAGFEGET